MQKMALFMKQFDFPEKLVRGKDFETPDYHLGTDFFGSGGNPETIDQ